MLLPPIGAQGLNMGLRDAADIADIVRDALMSGEDPGSPRSLETAMRRRGAPTSSAGRLPSISPTVPCLARFCRCNRCAPLAYI